MTEFFSPYIFVISPVFAKLYPKICFCVDVSLEWWVDDSFGMKKEKLIEISGVGGRTCIDFSCQKVKK